MASRIFDIVIGGPVPAAPVPVAAGVDLTCVLGCAEGSEAGCTGVSVGRAGGFTTPSPACGVAATCVGVACAGVARVVVTVAACVVVVPAAPPQ